MMVGLFFVLPPLLGLVRVEVRMSCIGRWITIERALRIHQRCSASVNLIFNHMVSVGGEHFTADQRKIDLIIANV